MAAKREGNPDPDDLRLEHIPDNVLLDPVDYLFADHCRQADMCEVLKGIAQRDSSPPLDPASAAAILQCLEVDLARHIEDEEHDLFPRLKGRAEPGDRFADILNLMDREHNRDRVLVGEVREGLGRLIEGKALKDPQSFIRAAEMLAEIHLSHLNWENAVVLPLARKRLTSEDLETIGRAMAARRGLNYPGDD